MHEPHDPHEPVEVRIEPIEAQAPAPSEDSTFLTYVDQPLVTLELQHDPRDNLGEIYRAESHPADPLKDEATRELTHRGGVTDPRTEFY